MQKIFYNIFLVNVVAVLVVFGAYESIAVILIMCAIERCLLCGAFCVG